MPEDPSTFGPREPVQGVYERDHPDLLLERAMFAFQSVLMIPAPVVGRKFREHVRGLLGAHHPRLRCSAARAVLEGRIPGIPKPAAERFSGSAKRIQQALCLLDILETIVYAHTQEQKHAKQNEKASPRHGRRGPRKKHTRHPQKGRPKIPRRRQEVRASVGQTSQEARVMEASQ